MSYRKHSSSRLNSPPPHVDHGYAWVILASCFMMRMLVDSIYGSLGMLLLNWQYHFDVNASHIAWVGSIYSCVLLCSGPIASALSYHFTYRVTVFGAGIVTFACFFALSFVTNFWQIFLIIPILGLAMSIPYQASCGFFTKYFDKKLVLATNTSSVATGMGFTILPTIFEIIIDHFGWRGTLLIVAAIEANICVCGVLLRTPSPLRLNKISKEENFDDTIQKQSGVLKQIAKSFDLSLFLNVKFIGLTIIGGLLGGGVYITIIFIIPNAVSIGIPEVKAPYIMTAFGIANLVSRFCPTGLLINNVMSPSNLGGITLLGFALSIFPLAFSKTFQLFVVFAAIAGFLSGISANTQSIVVFGSGGSKEKASGAMAWYYLCQGIGSLLAIILSGYLFDFFKSYTPAFLLGAALLLMRSITLFCEPYLSRWQTNLEERRIESVAYV